MLFVPVITLVKCRVPEKVNMLAGLSGLTYGIHTHSTGCAPLRPWSELLCSHMMHDITHSGGKIRDGYTKWFSAQRHLCLCEVRFVRLLWFYQCHLLCKMLFQFIITSTLAALEVISAKLTFNQFPIVLVMVATTKIPNHQHLFNSHPLFVLQQELQFIPSQML